MDISQYESIRTNVPKLELDDPSGKPLMYATGEVEETGEFEEHESDTNENGSPAMVATVRPVMARVTISLVSSDSVEYTSLAKRQLSSAIGRNVKRKGRVNNSAGEQQSDDRLDLAVVCTKAWVGWEDGGKEYPYSKKNALDLYTRLPFVRDQVEDFIHDRGNF